MDYGCHLVPRRRYGNATHPFLPATAFPSFTSLALIIDVSLLHPELPLAKHAARQDFSFDQETSKSSSRSVVWRERE
jgi:hypothetical protein